jgi:hypothetical protein
MQETIRDILSWLSEDVDDESSWAALSDAVQESAAQHSFYDHSRWDSPNANQTWRRAILALEAYHASAPTSEGRDQCSLVQFHGYYAEPGYTDPSGGAPIATGNWNEVTEYLPFVGPPQPDVWTPPSICTVVDDSPRRLYGLLESLGCELEWCDEWIECHECGGLVRTSPDCQDWHPSYEYDGDGGLVCHTCRPPIPTAECPECGQKFPCDDDHDYWTQLLF